MRWPTICSMVFPDDIGEPATIEELDALSGKRRKARLYAIKDAWLAHFISRWRPTSAARIISVGACGRTTPANVISRALSATDAAWIRHSRLAPRARSTCPAGFRGPTSF